MIDMTCDNDVDMKYSFMTPSIPYIMKYAQWVFSSLNISHTEEVVRLYHSDAALQIYLSIIFQKQPFPSVGDVIAIYCQEYGRSKSVNIHYYCVFT